MKDRNARTQAAWNASLHAAPAAVTNAAVEASIKNTQTRGVPVPAPCLTIVRGDGKVVRRSDDRKATYGGEKCLSNTATS